MKAIAKALVSAQQAFGPALKTKTNPHFKSKFADLAACVEAVIDGLNSNGIALIQNLHECDDGVIVETIFLHESGESYSAGKLHVPADKHTPQGYGSALTYARRYSLMTACGIAPEDDDGNSAKAPTRAPQRKQGVQVQGKKAAMDPTLAKARADFSLWVDERRKGMFDDEVDTPSFLKKLWVNQYGTEAYTDTFQLENLKTRISSGQINMENGETMEAQ